MDIIFDNFFWIVIAFIAFVFVFVIFVFVKSTRIILKNRAERRKNDLLPILTKEAKITSKRTLVSGGSDDSSVYTAYLATFEFPENKERLEFVIPSKEYGLLAENDFGKLTFQGKRFNQFQRTK